MPPSWITQTPRRKLIWWQMPHTHTLELCCNRGRQGDGSPSSARSCRQQSHAIQCLTGSCGPFSRQSGTSGICLKIVLSTTALHKVSKPWSAKQQRQLAYIAEYTADIWHISGEKNVVVDTLSRPGGGSMPAENISLSTGMGPQEAETCAGLRRIIRPGPQPPASATPGTAA
jgi:hypothetical protein